jgi:oligopeptide transport system ATP-binding protein
LRALDDVTLSLATGTALGVVGESGCGKSTLARAILGLAPVSDGELWWGDERLDKVAPAKLRELRREFQPVFQDPFGSLDPRMTVGESVEEALQALEGLSARDTVADRVAAAFDSVGLDRRLASRYPHELSGGQCQRVAIARATIVRPKLLICDEAVSALDVSVQAQIVNLLGDLRSTGGMALLFISHNLAVVRHLCDEIAVLYLGRQVESAATGALFDAPLHPYTQALLASVPEPDPQNVYRESGTPIGGELPSPLDPPAGCAFHTRCPLATERCRRERPAFEEARPGHRVACHHWREGSGG